MENRDISAIIGIINNRRQQHMITISIFRETITSNINDTSKVRQCSDLIREEEIAIRECQSILEDCFFGVH